MIGGQDSVVDSVSYCTEYNPSIWEQAVQWYKQSVITSPQNPSPPDDVVYYDVDLMMFPLIMVLLER